MRTALMAFGAAAGKLFEQIAVDEGDHYETYKGMLTQLQEKVD